MRFKRPSWPLLVITAIVLTTWSAPLGWAQQRVSEVDEIGEDGGFVSVATPDSLPYPEFADLEVEYDQSSADVRMKAVDLRLRLYEQSRSEDRPPVPFARPGRMIEILTSLAAAGATPKVLLLSSRGSFPAESVASFQGLGYDAVLVDDGREAFRQASEDASIRVMVTGLEARESSFQKRASTRSLRYILANFRADSRTKYLPVIVLIDEGRVNPFTDLSRLPVRLDRFQRDFAPTFVVGRPESPDDWQSIVSSSSGYAPKDPFQSPERRRELQLLAMRWLDWITQHDLIAPIYFLGRTQDVLFALGDDPELGQVALRTLARIPGVRTQELFSRVIMGIPPRSLTGSDPLTERQIRAIEGMSIALKRDGFGLSNRVFVDLDQILEITGKQPLEPKLAPELRELRDLMRQVVRFEPTPDDPVSR